MNGTSRRKRRVIWWLGLIVIGAMVLAGYYFRPSHPLPDGTRIDRVVVDKHERRLSLEKKGQTIKTYRISLGRNPEGHKIRQGDNRTPEGNYRIIGRNPGSRFHRSLRISYPSSQDVARARKQGVDPGGDIMIHGLPNGLGWIGPFHRFYDWTAGCIAVTDSEIDEIWKAVPNGTPIEIRP